MILGVISWFWIARHGSQQNSTGQHFGRMSIYVIAITLGQGKFQVTNSRHYLKTNAYLQAISCPTEAIQFESQQLAGA
jgi:hypothetical protein